MNISLLIWWRERRGDVITLVIQQGKAVGQIIKTPQDSRS